MTSLQDIGFYTLCDERVEGLCPTSPMWRCEILVTDRCNFRCPYCRGLSEELRGDMPAAFAKSVVDYWADDGLKNLRLSGGEPMLYPYLLDLVSHATARGCERIAISTNGSAGFDEYKQLVEAGVSDFSISLDTCCALVTGEMTGGRGNVERITENIRRLSEITYVTVGVVLTETNIPLVLGTVEEAHGLGAADIRIIPAVQNGDKIDGMVREISREVLDQHPILAYRVKNMVEGRPVRGLSHEDARRCFLPVDDSAVAGEYHFPCIIYLREGGRPISKVGPGMRRERISWSQTHDTHDDPICSANCLDVCVAHNNACGALQCRADWEALPKCNCGTRCGVHARTCPVQVARDARKSGLPEEERGECVRHLTGTLRR